MLCHVMIRNKLPMVCQGHVSLWGSHVAVPLQNSQIALQMITETCLDPLCHSHSATSLEKACKAAHLTAQRDRSTFLRHWLDNSESICMVVKVRPCGLKCCPDSGGCYMPDAVEQV